MVLSSRVREMPDCTCRDTAPLQIPDYISAAFDEPLVLTGDGRRLYVTLGQFSIIRLERDAQIFASCMNQVASVLEYPRYMIRTGFLKRRYFAVPDVLATKKEIASEFCGHLGYGAKLIFVQTQDGMTQLLNERLRQHKAQKRSVQMVKELIQSTKEVKTK